MQLFKKATRFDFMGKRKAAVVFSSVLLLISLASLVFRGLSFGIDFTGGSLIEVGYPEAADLQEIRSTLTKAGFPGAVVQSFGTTRDVLIRIAPKAGQSSAQLSEDVLSALRSTSGGKVEQRRVDFVGPQIGEELTEDGGLALLIALVAILVYVALRFEYRFAVGAVAALVHDVFITLGFFSVFALEFDLTVLAAALAVIGYSLNDTIVVFDRVRENFRKVRKGTVMEIINRSLNQTLARTLMTSVTTLLVLFALFALGGELIHGFATALIVGVIIGTYSSMYVASTTLVAMGVNKSDLMPVKKEGAEIDATP